MIVFDLKCFCGHAFEAWFKDSASFEGQQSKHEIICPLCGSGDVEKALMAPNISVSKANTGAATGGTQQVSGLSRILAGMRSHIENSCDYVGKEFPEEARKIHYGEADERGIYGEATPQEAEALRDEGVEIAELPFPIRDDA